MGLQAIRQYFFRVLPHSNALWLGTPNPLSFRTLVFGVFHSLHKHIRSLRLIHSSNSLNLLGVSAKAKYQHHPIKFLFSFSILSSIRYGLDLDVISRIYLCHLLLHPLEVPRGIHHFLLQVSPVGLSASTQKMNA
jgi:hypothetical protein